MAVTVPAHYEGKRYYTFNTYIRQTFGQRVRKIPIDAGFTCPNRDGTVTVGGCTYCNNESFTPAHADRRKSVVEQLRAGMVTAEARHGAAKYIAYFQAYSNTHAPVEVLESLYQAALSVSDVIGLAVGTRSDCIDDGKLDLLEALAQDHHVTVEYGIESAHDETLVRINRGHEFESVRRAVAITRARSGIHVGGHILFGLPGETRGEMLETVERSAELGLNMIKFHNLQIVENTALAREYRRAPFAVFSPAEYVALVCDALERTPPATVVERLFAYSPPRLLVTPHWDQTKPELLALVDRCLLERGTYQGAKHQTSMESSSTRV